jgi:hypothetical protein
MSVSGFACTRWLTNRRDHFKPFGSREQRVPEVGTRAALLFAAQWTSTEKGAAVESRKEYACRLLRVRFSVVVVHRTDGVTQDESFKFNLSHVFRSCLGVGGCVQRRKRPDGHETANATTVANRHESTINSDRGSVDQFDRRSLDGIATQIMALAGSTLLWLGVPPCVGPGIRGTTVRRTRGASATCAIGLSSRRIRGSRAFSR